MGQPIADRSQSLFTRRGFLLSAAASLGLGLAAVAGASFIRSRPPRKRAKPAPNFFEQVTPEAGIDTGVTFGDAIPRLIAAGALDPQKLKLSTRSSPAWVARLLAAPSTERIVFTRDTAPYLVNLLWPLGLANRARFNNESPINTKNLSGFASTGGWTLGRETDGSVYFNKVAAVPLTEKQEILALGIAQHSFRPCCDNSTYFQDCNHGSALLGLIELAVSQGMTSAAAYRIALAANAYWFPEQYAKTALYFWSFEHRPWNYIPPDGILGANFSSLSGWKRNVNFRLVTAGIELFANPRGQPACGI